MAALLIVVGVAAVLCVLIIGIYNGVVTLRNRFKNAFAQIDVQLKRRYDLIPNLVETAKGYLAHEKDTLEAVINARNQALSAAMAAGADPSAAGVMQKLGQAEGLLSGALGRLMVVAEQYPDLKANETMARLMEELTSTENRIAFARQAFNDSVTSYNNKREGFPAIVFAPMFGFSEADLLELEFPEGRDAPKVSF